MKTLLAVLTLLAIAPAMAAHAEEPPAFLLKWGGTGSADGQFDQPTGIGVAPDGSVYVLDHGNQRVQKFTDTGTFLLKWPSGDEYLDVGSDGVVYGHDGFDLYKYDAVGNQIGHLGGISPSGPIAIDPTGQYIYVCGAYVVGQFTVAGSHIRSWDTFYNNNTGNSGIGVGPDGDVYVSEAYQSRVHQFTSDGVFVRYWGSNPGSADGQFFGPAGIATDSDGNVFVCDPGNSRIQKFTRDGVFLTKWGTPGSTGDGVFAAPWDVAVDGDGNVYVMDHSNDNVQKFGDVATPTVKTTWGRIKRLYRGAAPTDER